MDQNGSTGVRKVEKGWRERDWRIKGGGWIDRTEGDRIGSQGMEDAEDRKIG